jgi:hypothetical protein
MSHIVIFKIDLFKCTWNYSPEVSQEIKTTQGNNSELPEKNNSVQRTRPTGSPNSLQGGGGGAGCRREERESQFSNAFTDGVKSRKIHLTKRSEIGKKEF